MKNLIFISIFLQVLTFGLLAQVKEKKGYVAIEMESTKSPLGKWSKIQKGDSTFIKSASGGAHLEFTGNNPSAGPADSPLEYTFKIKNAGTYHLIIRCSKRLAGAPGDKCNDCFVRVEGDYTSPYTGAPEKEPDYKGLSTNQKIFGGQAHPSMGWATTLDYLGHIKKQPFYNFKAGQTYKIVFSGRAQRFNPDYFVLYNKDMMTLEQAQLISPSGKLAKTPASNVVKTESTSAYCWSKTFSDTWDLIKPEGYKAQGLVEPGKQGFQINTIKEPHNEWATAKTVFNGKTGKHNIVLTSLQETDGECSYKVLINSKVVLEFQNPRILNTEIKDYTPYTVGIKGIDVPKGATIQVDFKSHSNGLVPEKNDFAWARGRWRSISIGSCSNLHVDKWIK